MGKKLAIKGHSTRGAEVIELLEMMGGKNTVYCGTDIKVIYTIDDKGIIRSLFFNDTILMKMEYDIFTLEEFLDKFPFKVNDKVIDKADGCPGVVCEMKWDEDVSDMKYCVAFGNGVDFGWFANDSIEFCKDNENLEETQSKQVIDKVVFRKEFCECCGSQRCSGQDDELEYCERFKNIMDNSGTPFVENRKMGPKSKFPPFEPMFKMNDELEYKIPDGYEITEVSKDKVFIKPIKSKYPKTYAECCEVLDFCGDYFLTTYDAGCMDKREVYGILQQVNSLTRLLICKSAYCKIVGEEMGLGKPWKPDWTNEYKKKFCIYYGDGNIQKGTWSVHSSILAFPTEEMRDAFHENFKDLIEECKELL